MPEVHYDSQGREVHPPAAPEPPAVSVPLPPSPPPPPPAAPAGSVSNGIAVAALVLGIISLLTGWFGLIFGILAVIFGFIGRKKAAQIPSGRHRGLASAGVILGFFGIALAAFWFLFLFGVVNLSLQNARTQAVDSSKMANANMVMTEVEIYKQDNKGKPLPTDLAPIMSAAKITDPGTVTYTTNVARDSYCLTVKNEAGAIVFVCKNGTCYDGSSCTP